MALAGDWWGADTDGLQTTGRSIHGLGTDADSAVNAVLNSYTSASEAVLHPVVSQALSSYRTTNQRGHLALPVAVRDLGAGTANGGATLADGENEATGVAKQTVANGEIVAAANGSAPTS